MILLNILPAPPTLPYKNFSTLLRTFFFIIFISIQFNTSVHANTKSTTNQEVSNNANSLAELLIKVKQGSIKNQQANQQRLKQFLSIKTNHQRELDKLKREYQLTLTQSSLLETKKKQNDDSINALQKNLNQQLGALKEVFGELQRTTSNTRSLFSDSIISAEYPNRDIFLAKFNRRLAKASQVVSIEEIEQFWYEMQREMTASGEIHVFKASLSDLNGTQKDVELLRIGTFNLAYEGQYLQYEPLTGIISPYPGQPPLRHKTSLAALQHSTDWVTASIDPSRGTVLTTIGQTPTISERIKQGGSVGKVILLLGIASLLLTLERIIALGRLHIKINSHNANKTSDNPLSRLEQVFQRYSQKNQLSSDASETLELKLGEVLLKEKPQYERFIFLLKIIAAASPLLGLLGTVIGMIITFQSITLFGTGDPKLMAGGISQALVTTVMGLTVAIPTLFAHTLILNWSKRLFLVLETHGASLLSIHLENAMEFESHTDNSVSVN